MTSRGSADAVLGDLTEGGRLDAASSTSLGDGSADVVPGDPPAEAGSVYPSVEGSCTVDSVNARRYLNLDGASEESPVLGSVDVNSVYPSASVS